MDPAFRALIQLMAVFLLWYTLAGLLYGQIVVPDGDPAQSTENAILAMALASIVPLAFAIFWPVAPWVGRPRLLIKAFPLFMLAFVPVAYVGYPWLLAELGYRIPEQEQLVYLGGEPARWWGPLMVVVGACVCAPIAEEIVFRGYLHRYLCLMVPTWFAIAVSSVLFGLIHYGAGWQYVLPLTVLGGFFGWLRVRTGGLLAPILAHALNNGLTVSVKLAFPDMLEKVYR